MIQWLIHKESLITEGIRVFHNNNSLIKSVSEFQIAYYLYFCQLYIYLNCINHKWVIIINSPCHLFRSWMNQLCWTNRLNNDSITHKAIHLFSSWINLHFWTNPLNKCFNDSPKAVTCFISEWIHVFNDSVERMIQWVAYKASRCVQLEEVLRRPIGVWRIALAILWWHALIGLRSATSSRTHLMTCFVPE